MSHVHLPTDSPRLDHKLNISLSSLSHLKVHHQKEWFPQNRTRDPSHTNGSIYYVLYLQILCFYLVGQNWLFVWLHYKFNKTFSDCKKYCPDTATPIGVRKTSFWHCWVIILILCVGVNLSHRPVLTSLSNWVLIYFYLTQKGVTFFLHVAPLYISNTMCWWR